MEQRGVGDRGLLPAAGMTATAWEVRGGARRAWARLSADRLFRSSFYLILSQMVLGGCGLLFWTLATHLYTSSVIGLTTAVIGGLALASTLATMGLPNVVLRFLVNEPNPRQFLRVAVGVVGAAALLVGVVWALVPGGFGVRLGFLGGSGLVLIMVISALLAMSVGNVVDAAFVARGEAGLLVGKSGVSSLAKLAVLPVLAFARGPGAFAAITVGAVVSAGLGLAMMHRRLPRMGSAPPSQSPPVLLNRMKFVVGNQAAVLVAIVPTALAPAIVVGRLGPAAAAYVAMPLSLLAIVTLIPSVTAQALLAEMSRSTGGTLAIVRRALLGTYLPVLLCVAMLVVFAPVILRIYGSDYATQGTTCLRLMALSGIFSTFNYVGDMALLARSRVTGYVVVNALGTMVVLGCVYVGSGFGVNGVGLGWLVGQMGYTAVSLIVIATVVIRSGGRLHSLPGASR